LIGQLIFFATILSLDSASNVEIMPWQNFCTLLWSNRLV
jgi:hypothetical protein